MAVWPNFDTVSFLRDKVEELSFDPPEKATDTRWFWFRPAEALVAELNGHSLALASLNMRLANLFHLLTSGDLGNDYIRGFNIKAERGDPDPPTAMLLVLLGLNFADLGDNNAGYSNPGTYPRVPPRNLRQRRFDRWANVFLTLLNEYQDRNGETFNFADIALHFIPGAVRILPGRTLKVQGSGFYVAQYKLERTWRSHRSLRVQDYRNKELRTMIEVTEPGVRTTLEPLDVVAALEEHFDVYEIDGPHWIKASLGENQMEAALDIVLRKETAAAINTGRGPVRQWRAHDYYAYLVLDEAAMGLDASWRPNLGTQAGEAYETLSNAATRALLQVYLYQRKKPLLPASQAVAPVQRLDLVADETTKLDPKTPLPAELERVIELKTPRFASDAPWIAPVITNRLRAAHWLAAVFGNEFVPGRIPEPVRLPRSMAYRTVGTFDALILARHWLIMPYFFERRVLIRPDGSINLKWLTEAYEPYRIGHRTWADYARYFLTSHTADHLIWHYWNLGQRYEWSHPSVYSIDRVSETLLATVDDPLDNRAGKMIATGPEVPYTATIPPMAPVPRMPSAPVPAADVVAPRPPGGARPPSPPPFVPGEGLDLNPGRAPPPPPPPPPPPETIIEWTPANALDREREASDWITDTVRPLLSTYTDMVARGWKANPPLLHLFTTLNSYASLLLSMSTPPNSAEARKRMEEVTGRLAVISEQLAEASALLQTAIRGEQEAYKQLRDHALSTAVEREKDDLYEKTVREASNHGISNADLLALVQHKLQTSSIDALVRAGQRSLQEQLSAVGEWWRTVVKDVESKAKRFASLAVHSESEALRNQVDRDIDIARFRQIEWNWPATPDAAIRTNITEAWDQLWKAKVVVFVNDLHRANVQAYLVRYEEFLRRVDESGALSASRPLLTVFTTYDDGQNVPAFVPAYAIHAESAKSFLESVLARSVSDKWTSDKLLAELSGDYLDCIISLSSNTADVRALWLDASERFAACYTRARRIEDYLAALLRVVTSSVGWFSYARRRHWAYDTKEDRSEAVPISILDWHGSLVWSSAKVSDSSKPKRVSKAELAALEAAQRTWQEAFQAARAIKTIVAGVEYGGLALRFLLCGKRGTLESAWAGLASDKQLLFIARTAFDSRLAKPVTVGGLLEWFSIASGEFLGDARHDLTQPIVKISREALLAQLDQLERNVLARLTTPLSSVALWDRTTGSPEGWWSAAGSWALAYPGQRTTTVLQPRTDQNDDLHGATIAITEFFAYGDAPLWKRFEHRPSLKGKADKVKPIQRPTVQAIEEAALSAASDRFGPSAQEAVKIWTKKDLATVRAMWYTFSHMYNRNGELLLDPAGPNLPHGHIVPRTDVIRDPIAEGTELVYLLRQEVAVLIDGCVTSTYGRTKLVPRRDRNKVLARVVERLLAYLDGKPTERKDTTDRLGAWVFQSSTSGSREALPDISRLAQWTQIVYLLSRDEGAMSTARERLTAEARLASPELVTSFTEVLKTLVNRLEGNVRQQQGTRIDPDRVPPTYPINTAEALEAPMPRVAWPLAAAQQIARSVPDGGDTAPLLSFFWSTLFRPDTDAERPVPFFTAVQPENPDARRTSGFSGQAIADYVEASKFATRLFVLTPTRLARMKHLWQRGVQPPNALLDQILSSTLRFIFVLDCDKHSIPAGLFKPADLAKTDKLAFQHLHERAAYCCIRTQEYTPLIAVRMVRWKVLSAWSAHDRSTPDRNTVPVSRTADLTGYFNPLYPTLGDPRSGGGEPGYNRLTAGGRDESLPKESSPIVLTQEQLFAVCERSTLLLESTALLDWYAQLEKLSWPRDELATLNGTSDTLGAAVIRDTSRDILRPERLDVEAARMREEWDTFKAQAVAYCDTNLPPVLGPASVASHRDQFISKLDSWRAEWDANLAEARTKAISRLSKLIQRKTIEEIRLREASDKIVLDFVEKVDEKDARNRRGFLLVLGGLVAEAGRRNLLQREQARQIVL